MIDRNNAACLRSAIASDPHTYAEEAGRTVIVSGGATGIGKAAAEAFARNGDRVLILGRRPDALEKTARELNELAGSELVTYASVDLSRPETIEALDGDGALPETVDVLVNNAGGSLRSVDTDLATLDARWEANWRSNVMSAVLLTQLVRPRIRRPGGAIVNVSSLAALLGSDAYGAAKAAMISWSHSMARALGPEGITVNAVLPGFVPGTEFFGDTLTPELHKAYTGLTMLGRAGQPSDVAGAILYLASPAAAWVTGQILQVNGGTYLGR
jgi:3-oxoacyl-[acyl-carrier protein] reductase